MYDGGGYGGGFVEPPRDNCADENEIFIVNARDSLGLSLLAACLWKGPLATDRDRGYGAGSPRRWVSVLSPTLLKRCCEGPLMLAGRRDGNAQNRVGVMINNITRLRENPLLRLMSCSWSTKGRTENSQENSRTYRCPFLAICQSSGGGWWARTAPNALRQWRQ